jgi:hypothetical protein
VDVPAFSGTMVQPIGPQFGADYDPASLHAGAQGQLSATLDCTTGSAGFDASSGAALIPASLALQRITTPDGVPACSP